MFLFFHTGWVGNVFRTSCGFVLKRQWIYTICIKKWGLSVKILCESSRQCGIRLQNRIIICNTRTVSKQYHIISEQQDGGAACHVTWNRPYSDDRGGWKTGRSGGWTGCWGGCCGRMSDRRCTKSWWPGRQWTRFYVDARPLALKNAS